jgi:hypothetical protein
MTWQRVMASNIQALGMVMYGGCLSASAENLTGYCLDTGSAGCQDRFIPFDGKSIDFCEETCGLTNPTTVRGLNATLYDFVCKSDNPSTEGGRVMILRQNNSTGKTTISLVTEHQTQPIVLCP